MLTCIAGLQLLRFDQHDEDVGVLNEMNVNDYHKETDNTVFTVCLIAAVDKALFVSSLDADPPAIRADIDSWLMMLVDSAGLRLGSVGDGPMSGSGGEW